MSASPMQPLQIELRFQGKEKLLLVEEPDFVIGRSSKLKVSIDSHNISREHLRVQLLNDKIWITDLSSTNGTFLGKKRLQAQVSVEYKGEELCIGPLGEGVTIRLSFGNEDRRSALSGVMERTDASIPPPGPRSSSKPAPVGIKGETEISLDSKFLIRDPGSQSDSSVQFAGQAIHSGDGQVFDPYSIEAKSKRDVLIELEKKRLRMERELAEIQKEAKRIRDNVENTLRAAEEKRREHHEHEQELIYFRKQIEESKAMVSALETDERRLRESAITAQKHTEELLRRRDEVERAYREDEARVLQLREELQKRETEQNRRAIELHAELERIQAESDFIRKKVKLEADTVQVEAQLRKAQTEKEIEELWKKKASIERELESLIVRSEEIKVNLEAQEEDGRRLEAEYGEQQSKLSELKMTIVHSENRRKQLEAETLTITDKIKAAQEEVQRILTLAKANADEIVRQGRDESAALVTEGHKKAAEIRAQGEEEIRVLRETTEKELRERQERLLQDVAEDRKEAEAAIVALRQNGEQEVAQLKQKAVEEYEAAARDIARQKQEAGDHLQKARADWEVEYAQLKQKAMHEYETSHREIAHKIQSTAETIRQERAAWEHEHTTQKQRFRAEQDAAVKQWKAEMDHTREKDLESLRLWRAEQDKKIQEKFTGDINALVHSVADATLMKIQSHPNQVITKTELMNTLEPQLREALTTEASINGPFNPNVKDQTKRFWIAFAKKSAVAALIGTVLWTVPGQIQKSFEQAKANRGTAFDTSDVWLKRLKESQAKAIALNLKARPEFQDNYTDNILYNEAYLELKQDPVIQKEWVIKLYQFFFEVLQMPDRVVVDFIPMESNLIRALGDLKKPMNKRNFAVNMEQMRAYEKNKLEQEIFQILGGTVGSEHGKKNWVKLRELESEFYQEKFKTLHEKNEAARALASEGAAAEESTSDSSSD